MLLLVCRNVFLMARWASSKSSDILAMLNSKLLSGMNLLVILDQRDFDRTIGSYIWIVSDRVPGEKSEETCFKMLTSLVPCTMQQIHE